MVRARRFEHSFYLAIILVTACGGGGDDQQTDTVGTGGSIASGGSGEPFGAAPFRGAAVGGTTSTGGGMPIGGSPTGGMATGSGVTGGTATGGGGTGGTGGTAMGGGGTDSTARGGGGTSGTATGGQSGGGTATGGQSGGGPDTGGQSSGGTDTGGQSGGGTDTGGQSSGGTDTGGQSSGGTDTGGQSGGGTDTGGQSGGGTDTGGQSGGGPDTGGQSGGGPDTGGQSGGGPDAGGQSTGGASTGEPGDYPLGNPPVPSPACGTPTTLTTGERTINSTNQNRVYYLDIPSNYDPNQPYRLFYISHWIGSRYQDMVGNNFYGLKTLAQSAGEPAIFIAPSSDGSTWQEKDHALFDDLLAFAKDNLCFDTSRVFATGFSFGGMITYSLSTNHQADIRAAVGIAPANYNIWLPQKTHEPIAWMQTTGMGDTTCPWVQGSSSTNGAKYIGEEKAADNNCTPAEIPTWQSGAHLCFDYSGCNENHPVKVCTFNGGHQAESSDPGSNTNWIPEVSWEFFTQF